MWRNCSKRVYDCSWDSVEGRAGKRKKAREGRREGGRKREREHLWEVPSKINK